MPWDFSVVSHRPIVSLNPTRAQELDNIIRRDEASFWDILHRRPMLWELFPTDFVSIDMIVQPCFYLSSILHPFPTDVVQIVVEFARESFQFPEIIRPRTCNGFVCEVRSRDTAWPSFTRQEEKECLVRVMPRDLIRYAQEYKTPREQELVEYYPAFATTLPSPHQLFTLWKTTEREDCNEEYPDLGYYLHRLLFCYQCQFLGSHGFCVVCDH